MPEDKEWYTQKEVAAMLNIPVRRLYSKVNTLRNAGAIQWKENPDDQRAILIHKNSISVLTAAMQERGTSAPLQRPVLPYSIKRDDENLMVVEDAISKYDLDEEWVLKNLTRYRFGGHREYYVYIPELEYKLDEVEIIPPGQ